MKRAPAPPPDLRRWFRQRPDLGPFDFTHDEPREAFDLEIVYDDSDGGGTLSGDVYTYETGRPPRKWFDPARAGRRVGGRKRSRNGGPPESIAPPLPETP